MSTATVLRPLAQHKTVLLTTYRDDGVTAVDTVTRIAADGDRVLFRLREESEEARRIAGYPMAEITPCTLRGHRVGPAVRGEVRLLTDQETSQRAARTLNRRHPIFQGWGVPISHRLLRHRASYYEFLPLDDQHIECLEGWPD